MNDTLTPEQTQTLLASIPKIEQAGGPEWYGWCVLGMDSIEGTNAFNEDELVITHSPPAVAAAVIAWAGEVRAWIYREHQREVSVWAQFDGQWASVARGFRMPAVTEHPSQLAASVALISAVAEGLENINGIS